MNIFVGNLSTLTTEKQLENLFTEFGEVKSVSIAIDRFTRRSRGFAFVEMEDKANAEKAIEKLNNTMLNQQSIVVNEARVKSSDKIRNHR